LILLGELLRFQFLQNTAGDGTFEIRLGCPYFSLVFLEKLGNQQMILLLAKGGAISCLYKYIDMNSTTL
jgi:hypothetical protein